MKKLLFYATTVIIALSVALVSCEKPNTPTAVAVSSVTLNQTTAIMNIGDTLILQATVLPENADNKVVTWLSDNPAVATVKNGKLTAVSEGTTNVIVTTQDGGKIAICAVTVNADDPIPVTDVTLNITDTVLDVGNFFALIATVLPTNATDKNVFWTSDNSAVAMVDSNGKVTALSVGSATITVTTQDGDKTAICNVKVIIPVSSVTLNISDTVLLVGNTLTLAATVLPENATNKTVSWTSSVPTVATVNNGTVTAIAVGTTTITVTTQDGNKTATCEITVTPIAVTGVTLNETSVTIVRGNTQTLIATVLPTDATNKTISWSSSNTSVASVVNGTITAHAVGTATITVTTQDGNKTATCEVTVTYAPLNVPTCNNTATPGFNNGTAGELGAPYFKTNREWTISNGTINQIWSDVVLAPGCNKITYSSGTTSGTYSSDCQTNLTSSFDGSGPRPTTMQTSSYSNYFGDIFSWCAVARFKDTLCPAPWRVPTNQDFANLDIVLRGSGNGMNSYTDATTRNRYLANSGTAGRFWAGAYGGYCSSNGQLFFQGTYANYWSATEVNTTNARALVFNSGGDILPQRSSNKEYGYMLRCVR